MVLPGNIPPLKGARNTVIHAPGHIMDVKQAPANRRRWRVSLPILCSLEQKRILLVGFDELGVMATVGAHANEGASSKI